MPLYVSQPVRPRPLSLGSLAVAVALGVGSVPAAGAAAQTAALPSTASAENAFELESGGLKLRGTLTVPPGAGPFPGAVILAGSGPSDRDGNSPGGATPQHLALLARGLAERGIASLRYDKRGLPSNEGTVDLAATTVDDLAADAVAAVRALDARPEVGPVFLLGHSEGGTLALLAAGSGAPIRGLVLVATMGRPFGVVLREQLGRQLPASTLEQFDAAWDGYVRSDAPVDSPAVLGALFSPVNRRYVQSWERVDPVALVARLELPVLVVQGTTDVQITEEDARRLAGARSGVQLELIAGMNHMLKQADGPTALAQMASYRDPTLPLAPRVVPAIADWIAARARERP